MRDIVLINENSCLDKIVDCTLGCTLGLSAILLGGLALCELNRGDYVSATALIGSGFASYMSGEYFTTPSEVKQMPRE